MVIKEEWTNSGDRMMDKISETYANLGKWQHNRYNDSKKHIRRLVKSINQLMDRPINKTLLI